MVRGDKWSGGNERVRTVDVVNWVKLKLSK